MRSPLTSELCDSAVASISKVEIMSVRRNFTSVLSAGSLAAICLCLATSCIAIVPYEPKSNLLQTLGEEESVKRFGRVLAGSTDWRFNFAEAGEDSFVAEKLQVIMGAFWIQHTIPNRIQIYYANVSRIEVYENNVVYLRSPSNHVTLKATFADRDTAFEFADLVASFKARSGN